MTRVCELVRLFLLDCFADARNDGGHKKTPRRSRGGLKLLILIALVVVGM